MPMTLDGSHISPAREGSYPLREGNVVRPLVDGEPAFRRICEAVEAARHSVWVTVAFLDPAFEMPDGRGSLFEFLDRAAARGLDVRGLFWSEPEIEKQIADEGHFVASEENFAMLRDRASGIRARWDRVPDHCQHQKSWVVDAGEEGEVAFVGGINLDAGSVVPPGHPDDPTIPEGKGVHDLYVEVRGPAASDVVHNFVQRWNEASERERPHGAYPDLDTAADLTFPEKPSPTAGRTPVQITRSVLPGLYRNPHPAAEAEPFSIEDGEFSILEQYLEALASARRTVYMENQLLLCPKIIPALAAAVERGVCVTVLVPRVTMPEVVKARSHPRAKPVFDMLAALGEHETFTFAALGKNRAGGGYEDIYVHAKFAAVDDCWATIGSANTMFRSFKGDTEMNASFWDPEIVRALRVELLHEHLGEDTASLDDLQAFARYREVARVNTAHRSAGRPMTAQVFATDPARWAIED